MSASTAGRCSPTAPASWRTHGHEHERAAWDDETRDYRPKLTRTSTFVPTKALTRTHDNRRYVELSFAGGAEPAPRLPAPKAAGFRDLPRPRRGFPAAD
jgi:hypothetical protein